MLPPASHVGNNNASSSSMMNGGPSSSAAVTAPPRSGGFPGRVSLRQNSGANGTANANTRNGHNPGMNGHATPNSTAATQLPLLTSTQRQKRRTKLRHRRRLASILQKLFGINFYDARHSQLARIIVICLLCVILGLVGILCSVLWRGLHSTVGADTGHVAGGMVDDDQIAVEISGNHHHHNHNNRPHHHHHKINQLSEHRINTYNDLDEGAGGAGDGSHLENNAVHPDDVGDGEDDGVTDAAAAALAAATAAKAKERDRAEEVARQAIADADADTSGASGADDTGGKAKPSGKTGIAGDGIAKNEMQKTKNANGNRQMPTFKLQLEGAPPCTELQPADISYTLVTQLSTDRLWMMEQHCHRWGLDAPISVVFFTDETPASITDQLLALGCRRGQLTVQTLPTKAYAKTEYPVNKMRNMALAEVKTSHVMYVDVDFWEAERLREVLEMDSIKEEFAKDHKLAAVVPAFQILRQCKEYRDCREENLAKMPNTTEQMMDLVKNASAGAFDPTNRGGHGSTSYGAWYLQKEGEMYDIPCFKSKRYEPYLAFRYCQDLPPFQEQFTGYGKNKLTCVMQMRRMGWDFVQLGQIFLVHYPHLDSASRLEWNEGPKKIQDPVQLKDGTVRRREPKEVDNVDWSQYQRGQVDQLYVDFRHWLETDVPDNARVQPCKDAVDDDSMLWINKDE